MSKNFLRPKKLLDVQIVFWTSNNFFGRPKNVLDVQKMFWTCNFFDVQKNVLIIINGKPKVVLRTSSVRILSCCDRPADGRWTVVADGRQRRPCRQRRRKKKHLIEAAPFGRLDQMLSTAVQGGLWEGFAPPARNQGVWGAAPPSQIENFLKFRKFSKKLT